MYNIYINERLLKLASDKDSITGAELVFRLSGDEPVLFLKELTVSFEQQQHQKTMLLTSRNIDKTWERFKKSYSIVNAAGGIVLNEKNYLLMIYRNNRWDLPKGKVERNEETDKAALREVEEECGLQNLKLEKQLSTTYHTYEIKSERILKRTYWFKMSSSETKLIPQTEEGITEARWMNKQEVKKASMNSYASIVSLLTQHHLI